MAQNGAPAIVVTNENLNFSNFISNSVTVRRERKYAMLNVVPPVLLR